jgi:hypothetical protein
VCKYTRNPVPVMQMYDEQNIVTIAFSDRVLMKERTSSKVDETELMIKMKPPRNFSWSA